MPLLTAALFALAPLQAQLGPVREVSRSASRSLWVVDADGGGDFTTIQAAIDAADSGDAIEVRSGAYAGFVWESKDLVVFGSGTPAPTIENEVRIQEIDGQDSAVLRNFTFRYRFTGLPLTSFFLVLSASAGTIWLEDCTFTGTCGCVYPIYNAVTSLGCENVVLQRCSFDRPPPPLFNGFIYGGKTAFQAFRSRIFAYECEFRGPAGGSFIQPGSAAINSEGGSGMELGEAQLFASGCAFLGGAPGSAVGACIGGTFLECSIASPGGIGLIVDASSSAQSLDSTFTAGPGRPGGLIQCLASTMNCPPGPAGQPFTGTVTTIPLPARDYRIETPAQESGTYRLSAEGEPGWFLFSLFSERPWGIPLPIYFGTLLTAPPLTIVHEGTIPASGLLEKDVRVPPLVLGTPFVVRFAQGLLFDELANAYLTSGSVLIVR